MKKIIAILSLLSISLYGQTSEDYFKKGNAKCATKDFKGAIEDYNKAIELNPENDDIYFKRGIAKAYSGDNKAAIKDYKRAAKKGSRYADTAYYLIGWHEKEMTGSTYINGKYAQTTNYGSAREYFTKAIELNPKYSAAYFERGMCEEKSGKREEAVEDFTIVIQLSVYRVAESYYWRAFCRGLKTEGSCADLKKALELGYGAAEHLLFSYCDFKPTTAEPAQDYYKIGFDKYWYKKDYKGAIDDFTKAIELNPNYAGAYFYRGFCKSKSKDKEGACLDWKKAAELGSADAKVMIERKCK